MFAALSTFLQVRLHNFQGFQIENIGFSIFAISKSNIFTGIRGKIWRGQKGKNKVGFFVYLIYRKSTKRRKGEDMHCKIKPIEYS